MESIWKSKQESTIDFIFLPIDKLITYTNNNVLDTDITCGIFTYRGNVGKVYSVSLAAQCKDWIFTIEQMNTAGQLYMFGKEIPENNDMWYLCGISNGYRYNAGGFKLHRNKHFEFMVESITRLFWPYLYPNLDIPTSAELTPLIKQ